jgi:hypothetical protein
LELGGEKEEEEEKSERGVKCEQGFLDSVMQ